MSTWERTTETKINLTFHNPILIEGLPGIGNVGKIAVDFMVEELKAVKLCSFFSYRFPHSVFINNRNLVEMPKIDVYYKKFNNSKKRDLLLLVGDIQPIDEESCYTFCDEILTFVKMLGCQEIITTGGIGLQHLPEKPRVYVAANDGMLLNKYLSKELGVQQEIFGVVGPIIGVSGILLGLGKKRQVSGVALLAETFGHPMYLGVKGAQEILRVLEKKFAFGIDLKKMNKEIIEMEKELMKKTKEWAADPSHGQAGARAKGREAGYIG